MARAETRPQICTIDRGAELRRWYWLKSELAAEAKRLGLKSSGAKFTILDRLCHFLDTGSRQWPGDVERKIESKFDWHTSVLTKNTIITDNYKNTQNVRRFFQANAESDFKFNVGLLDWFKNNVGKTLGDALIYWQRQRADDSRTKIKPHNQFNQYCRDFLDDNPGLGMKDVRKVWALKRNLPSDTGKHVYEKSDLKLLPTYGAETQCD